MAEITRPEGVPLTPEQEETVTRLTKEAMQAILEGKTPAEFEASEHFDTLNDEQKRLLRTAEVTAVMEADLIMSIIAAGGTAAA